MASKIAMPIAYSEAIVRGGILARLLDDPGTSLVSIVAPAGYGKTTLLRQWAERSTNATYVRIDSGDDDPIRLLSAIAGALGTVEPLDPRVERLLTSPAHSLDATILPQFADALWQLRGPILLMLDDVQAIVDRTSLDALAWLAIRLPPTVQLAVASRTRPKLPLARWRTEGRLLEVGAVDLALDEADAAEILRSHGMEMSAKDIRALLEWTEGWPAATYLAITAQRGRPRVTGAPLTLRGDEASLGEYMRQELLAPLDADEQRWLYRSSTLEPLSGSLCDAVLETRGSLARLRALDQRNLFVVPLDEQRTTFRYHRLFGDVLRDELEVREPGAAATIRQRAARWCEDHGDIERAIEFAHDGGDLETVARLVGRHGLPLYWRGRDGTVSRWLGWFDDDALRDRWVPVAVIAGFHEALNGRTRAAERWLAAAERSTDASPLPDGSTSKAPWVALLRGHMTLNGVAGAVADAKTARAGLAPDGFWRPNALLLSINVGILTGAFDVAEAACLEAIEEATMRRAMTALSTAYGQLAVIALQRGEIGDAETAAQRGLDAIEAGGLEDYSPSGLLYAVSGRLATANGSVEEAKRFIGRFNRLRPQLNAAVPVLAVLARLEAVRACIALRDAAAARTLMLEIHETLRVRPNMGWIASEATAIGQTVDAMRQTAAGPWTLTTAELRLLAFLPTHLTFREIAQRLFVSPHTIKTQAVSIYGKLGVSSRRAAIEHAVTAGLLDESVLRYPVGGGGIG